MPLIRYSIFIAFTIFQTLASAQQKEGSFKRCAVETINFEQGLLNNETNSVLTDTLGFTWVSTRSGLQRFNGCTLENIHPVIGKDSITIDSHVYLFALQNGNIWISYKNGVLEYNPFTRLFHRVISFPPSENSFLSLVPLLETKEGIWCMQNEKGIVIYDREKNFKASGVEASVSMINNIINSEDFITRSIVAVNKNYIFIRASESQILQINTSTHKLKDIQIRNGIIGIGCSQQKLFITDTAQLSVINIQDDTVNRNFPLENIFNEELQYSCIQYERNGKLLISLNRRMFEFDISFTQVKELTTLNEDPVVPSGSIHHMYNDRFGRTWLLTNNDIRVVQNFDIPFQHFIYKNEASNYVRAICYDGDDHLLLAGCIYVGEGVNGGIQLFDTSGNPLWTKALVNDNVRNISNIEKLERGKYLVVTSDQQGWYLLSLPEKQLQPFKLDVSPQIKSQLYTTVWPNNLQRINDSTLLIACSTNISRCVFNHTTLKAATPVLPFSSNQTSDVSCFIYTTDSTYWVGTTSGILYEYKNGEGMHSTNVPGNNIIRCFAEDSLHHVYVGTDKGIYVYSNSLELKRTINVQSGLLNDYIYAMLAAGKSSLFASTKLGLSYVPSNGEIKNYTSELGLQGNEFNTQSALKTPNGKYFFGGINGITAFYPSALNDVKDNPVLNITNLLINDSLYNFSPAVWRNDSIILKYDQNHLQFNFAALGFLTADEFIYKYRMKGFEENWQTTHQPNGIKYMLPPGNYTLELSCSPIFSASSIFKKNIVIIVAPPWWQTWWFRISVIILSIGIIAFIVQQYNRRKYLKRIQALQLQQRIQQERERISRDLHDNLGAYAAAIASNISVIKNSNGENDESTMNQLNDNSQSIINQLNDTIWALNREAVLLTAISDRYKVFIQKIQSNYPRLTISVDEKITTDIKLSPTNALHLFRVMQEALNNAVRHSGCTNILVQIISHEDWKIIIRDDGKGLGISAKEVAAGNGLRNMKLRGKEAGWNVSWINANPHGTEVIISTTSN